MKQYLPILITTLFLIGCNTDQQSSADQAGDTKSEFRKYIKIQGKTMGTSYNITYFDPRAIDHKVDVDGLLERINQQVSTYEHNSFISMFNRHKEVEFLIDIDHQPNHFIQNFKAAKTVYEKSKGYFDPTVMPLVNYWGFGYTPKRPVEKVDSTKIKTIIETVGFDQMELEYCQETKPCLTKSKIDAQLDFSAIAKGYACDALGILMDSKGCKDYMIEIGGEVFCKGQSPSNKAWTFAINTPDVNASTKDAHYIVSIQDKGMATSGNYRNFHEVNGQKYSHTINPKTGFPELNQLLSTTIITNNCMLADAYATACMVIGLDKALDLVDQENLDALFIYSDENGDMKTKSTEGFEKNLIK